MLSTGKFRVAGSSDQVYVAVKVLKEGSSEETEKAFAQEVLLMSCLHHDNILKLVAVSTEERPFCMVFEYMANGDLNQFLRKNDPDKALEGSKEISMLFIDLTL